MITRFAPSPTGHLHIGGLRTALYNFIYCMKLKNEGIDSKFILRIEDTDKDRNNDDALRGIFEAFQWAGLTYEDEVLYQSQRTEIYKIYINKLLESKSAYYCYLTKEELEKMDIKDKIIFTRKYREMNPLDIQIENKIKAGIVPSIRIKAPLTGEIILHDGIKGNINFDASTLDDFVIARNDGSPTYNFVVAIDDALSGVTDVIRGDDHTSNTPKQIIIYNALGFKIPNFFHVPMICNESGKKLSKRDGALSVLEYRNEGILKEALLNFLFRLGFGVGNKEVFTMDEMIECFNPKEINAKSSICNFSKLLWLNTEHIKLKNNDELKNEISNFLDFRVDLKNEFKDEIEFLNSCIEKNLLLDELRQRSVYLKDFLIQIRLILKYEYDKDLLSKLNEENKENLQSFMEFLKSGETEIKEFLKLKNLKSKFFIPFLRLALLGQKGGIELQNCIKILGIKEIISRINKFLKEII